MGTNRNLLILKSYIKPVLISLIVGMVYFLIKVFGTLFSRINVKEVPFKLILNFIYYNVGWIITLIVPFAFLFSTIFVFARLPYEKFYEEIKYERHSFSFILLPIGFCTIIFSIALFFYNDNVLPDFNYKESNVFYELSLRTSSPNELSENDKEFSLPREELPTLNLDMLNDKLNYLIKSKESSKNKGQRFSDYFNKETNRIESEVQKRYAISFSPFFLLFFGVPLGFLIRNQKPIAIIAIGLVSWLIYYLILDFTNIIAPIISPIFIWLSNFLYLLVGLILLMLSNIKFKKLAL